MCPHSLRGMIVEGQEDSCTSPAASEHLDCVTNRQNCGTDGALASGSVRLWDGGVQKRTFFRKPLESDARSESSKAMPSGGRTYDMNIRTASHEDLIKTKKFIIPFWA